jgi:hypothetical protein
VNAITSEVAPGVTATAVKRSVGSVQVAGKVVQAATAEALGLGVVVPTTLAGLVGDGVTTAVGAVLAIAPSHAITASARARETRVA